MCLPLHSPSPQTPAWAARVYTFHPGPSTPQRSASAAPSPFATGVARLPDPIRSSTLASTRVPSSTSRWLAAPAATFVVRAERTTRITPSGSPFTQFRLGHLPQTDNWRTMPHPSSPGNRASSTVGNRQIGRGNAGTIDGADPSEWSGIFRRHTETRAARQTGSDVFASRLLSWRMRPSRLPGRDQFENFAGFLF
jgi:hypothetical protein